jgi:hypothetical protein
MARIAKNSSLYPEDIEIVKSYGEARGLDWSSALRLIIREWSVYRVARIEDLPHPADAQPVPVVYVERAE